MDNWGYKSSKIHPTFANRIERLPFNIQIVAEIDPNWLCKHIGVAEEDWCHELVASLVLQKEIYRFRTIEQQTLALLTWG